MITLLHGDNQLESRKKLLILIEKERVAGRLVTRLEAKNLQLAQLEEALSHQNLFAAPALLVIEGLNSLPKSARQTQLVEFVCSTPPDFSIIAWEGKEVGKVALRPWQKALANIIFCKPTETLFSWLDSLSWPANPQLIKTQHTAFQENGVDLCLALLIGRIRLLIQIIDGASPKGAPFYLQKIKSQSRKFTLEQLLNLHRKLVRIDDKIKTSTLNLDLAKELDLLWLSR